MRVSVIGAGYVGLVTGACLADKGHDVICMDVDPEKVSQINAGSAPIHERGLAELLLRHAGRKLKATTDLDAAVLNSDITLIAVGTPFNGRGIDLNAIWEACRRIGLALRRKRSYHLVVIKSTVVPGTTDEVALPALEAASRKRAGRDFGVGMNPEFLTEGEAVADFFSPDRIVLGASDARSLGILEKLYQGFDGVAVIKTNPKTAEMIKYTSNCLLATMISFTNEIANLCSSLGGLDVVDVMKGVHLSRYLSPHVDGGHRVEAPINRFLEAGCGFGGSCLPKDIKALIAHGERAGVPMQLLEAVIHINECQPQRLVCLLKKHFPSLRGLRVALLGLAFKPDTTDMRESPAIPILRELLAEGARVKAHDPVANDEARKILAGEEVEFWSDLEGAVRDVDAVLVVTRWEQFKSLPRVLRDCGQQPLVLDGRRMLDKSQTPRYAGIGC